jgi:hypothetical protein
MLIIYLFMSMMKLKEIERKINKVSAFDCNLFRLNC